MESFYRVITPLLGVMIGLLVAFPASATEIGAAAWILPCMGGLVGYRKRDSRAFFYFSLFCVTILAGVVGTSVVEPNG